MKNVFASLCATSDNAPIAANAAAIRAGWAALLIPQMTVTWKAVKVEVARSGDMAYVVGTYALAVKNAKGQPDNDTGKLIEVWKK